MWLDNYNIFQELLFIVQIYFFETFSIKFVDNLIKSLNLEISPKNIMNKNI